MEALMKYAMLGTSLIFFICLIDIFVKKVHHTKQLAKRKIGMIKDGMSKLRSSIDGFYKNRQYQTVWNKMKGNFCRNKKLIYHFVRENRLYAISYIIITAVYTKLVDTVGMDETYIIVYRWIGICAFIYFLTIFFYTYVEPDAEGKINKRQILFAFVFFIIMMGIISLNFLVAVSKPIDFLMVVFGIIAFIFPSIALLKCIFDFYQKRSILYFGIVFFFIVSTEIYVMLLFGTYDLSIDKNIKLLKNLSYFEQIVRIVQYGAYIIFQQQLVQLGAGLSLTAIRVEYVYQYFIGVILNIFLFGVVVSYSVNAFFEKSNGQRRGIKILRKK